MTLLWHYTTGEKFHLIVEQGVIRATACLIDPGERPAVWFSTNQWWEPTASKFMMVDGRPKFLTMQETSVHGNGLVRFGVGPESASISWREFRAISGISPEMYRNLGRAGKKRGADPHQWYASFEPVPREKWLAVEIMHKGAWVPVQKADDGNVSMPPRA